MALKHTQKIGKPTKTEDWLNGRKGRTLVTPKNRKWKFDWVKEGNKYFVILDYKGNRMRVKLSDYTKTDTDMLLSTMEDGMNIKETKIMKLTKTQLREIIKEEIQSLNEHKKTFDSFKKDFDNVVSHADAYLKGDKITIYLDNNPNKEKNIINKLVRTKYSDKLKKARSEDDVMIFKITENLVVEAKSKEASMVLQLMDQDYSYDEALKATLKKYKNVNKSTLEKELNKYI